LPFGLYHAWRYNYFAWEFPNTYYGKLERRATFPLLEWTSKSWQYTRDFAFEMGWGFFLPVFTMGAIGSRGWRWPLAFGIAAGTAVLVTLVEPAQRALLPAVVLAILGVFWVGLATVEERPPKALFLAGVVVAAGLIGASELLRQGYDMAPNQIPVFDALKTVPPYALISVGVVLFAASWGARFEASRRLTTGLVLAAVLFALIAQWDWMNGYRWYAPAVVPGSLLFALGAHGFAQVLQRTFGESTQTITVSGAIAIIGLTLLTVPANVAHTQKIAAKPQTKPVHVRHRVNFVNGVRDTLHMDYERFIDLDVDQGAHLYWSDFEMLDLAGLIDVPFAQHKFEQPFVREYLFYEKVPHFIHVHGGWAGSSRIPRLKEFREGYVEIPGYIANRREFHIGNHVRRNLMLADSWPPDARVDVRGEPVRFDNDVMVHGIRVPSEPAEKGKFYVEIGVSLEVSRKRKEDNFRVWLIAERGAQHHVWDLAPTYDWITPRDWKRGEIFQGRYSLDLPEALTAGTYDLVVVVVNSDGSVAQVLGSSAGPATVATGELRYEDALTVLDATAWSKAREQDRANAIAHASASRCFEAEHAWLLARRHSGHDRAWIDEQWGELRRAFATCYAEASDAYDDPTKKVPDLVKAREHDHWAPAYRDRAREVADALMERGTASREGQDWERAYRYFADAVAVDRSRSWARRWAEEARAYRLEIDDETMAAKEAKRKADVEKRRAELKQRSKSPPR
ncbi:MAG: MFS transporter, partial [Myxococcota bacterium]